jgi:hypothetical protein
VNPWLFAVGMLLIIVLGCMVIPVAKWLTELLTEE